MNRSSDASPTGDYVRECRAPLHFGADFAARNLECQLDFEYEQLGRCAAAMLRSGRRLAMELQEHRDRDVVSRCLLHVLHLRVREIPELTMFYQKFERSLRAPPPLPPVPKSLLRRLGEFVAETWEEAGETVRQCKAA